MRANRSVFGEDALVNVSVERKDHHSGSGGADGEHGKLSGYIRIRCVSTYEYEQYTSHFVYYVRYVLVSQISLA